MTGSKPVRGSEPQAAAAAAAASAPISSPVLRLVPQPTQDREFLPAALEIIETPPSVISVSFIWLICAIFAAAIGWSYFGKLDIYATAQGKIQPVGRSKVVQPLDPGKIRTVLVENGTRVKEGDVLLDLDPTETTADQDKLTQDLESADAEATRRSAAIEAARLKRPSTGAIEFKRGTSELVRQREERALAADLAQLAASQEILDGQLAQQYAKQIRLRASIAEREKLIVLSKERVEMREASEKKGAGSRALIIDALAQYETELVSQVGDEGQLQEIPAAVQETRGKIADTIAKFIADQTQKLVDAERKRDQLQQDLVKAQFKNERMRLKAPISGIVQQLAVTTVGQVVSGSQTLMIIVPLDTPLEIEMMVLNKDIGFVRVGQPTVVKVDAFPFTRYGTIDGSVTKVSSDAVDMRDAPNLSDASASVKAQGMTPNSGTNKPELAFPVTIKLARQVIEVDGREVNLSPGMTVTVEIKTGTRRVIDYLLSPLREVVSQTAHER